MKSVAVFCGSKLGADENFKCGAVALGKQLAQQQIRLVYGGGNVGLMGTIANAVMQAGGEVIGVIPEKLQQKELAHNGLTELYVVADMHERKAKMAELADGFIAMPGGAGTLEEIAEVWTWAQLGYHHKPCAFYNINGFYNPLLTMIKSMVEQQFMLSEYQQMLLVDDQPKSLLRAMTDYQPPQEKWS